ncbi:MAG TPA: hypothetical protein VHC20_05795 [Candidatus Paceibacterota bacterium]|nr:hypothetical protein [Candidatus Paceibacterota bacterium]
MASKKPVLHKKKAPEGASMSHEEPDTGLDKYGLPKPPVESPEFEDFARRVMQVPKSEIDAQEKKDQAAKKRKKKVKG